MNKKLTAIFAIMMIALCLFGISYALWEKSVYLDVFVNTDNVDVVFSGCTNMDPKAIPPDISKDPKDMNHWWDKDVGWTNVTGIGTEELTVELYNVYPCYFNDLEVEINCTGSVPVKVQNITITADNFHICRVMGSNTGPVYIEWADNIGSQLDPNSTPAGSSLKIHVEQCAEQFPATYTFHIKIVCVQWNDYDYSQPTQPQYISP